MQVVPLQRISSADHLRRVATLAAVFTLSVMAGNTSLKYIPVSFNQAIGATTPAWTAGIAYAFAGTTEKRSTYLALAPVILGVVLATGKCAREGARARASACVPALTSSPPARRRRLRARCVAGRRRRAFLPLRGPRCGPDCHRHARNQERAAGHPAHKPGRDAHLAKSAAVHGTHFIGHDGTFRSLHRGAGAAAAEDTHVRAHAHAPSWPTHGSTHALAGASIRGANEPLYFIASPRTICASALGRGARCRSTTALRQA